MTRPKGNPVIYDGRFQERLRRYLKNHHRGERAAVAKPALLKVIRQGGVRLDRRDLDEALRVLRHALWPVLATDQGVFWAQTRAEALKARQYVAARFADMRQTVDDYDRIASRLGETALPDQAPADAKGQRLLWAGLAAGS
jgi:hypothetical protein